MLRHRKNQCHAVRSKKLLAVNGTTYIAKIVRADVDCRADILRARNIHVHRKLCVAPRIVEAQEEEEGEEGI